MDELALYPVDALEVIVAHFLDQGLHLLGLTVEILDGSAEKTVFDIKQLQFLLLIFLL